MYYKHVHRHTVHTHTHNRSLSQGSFALIKHFNAIYVSILMAKVFYDRIGVCMVKCSDLAQKAVFLPSLGVRMGCIHPYIIDYITFFFSDLCCQMTSGVVYRLGSKYLFARV